MNVKSQGDLSSAFTYIQSTLFYNSASLVTQSLTIILESVFRGDYGIRESMFTSLKSVTKNPE